MDSFNMKLSLKETSDLAFLFFSCLFILPDAMKEEFTDDHRYLLAKTLSELTVHINGVTRRASGEVN